jgi:hypothetical protein
MGSDLYISIEVCCRNTPDRNPNYWSELFEGPSRALDRGYICEAFRQAGIEHHPTRDESEHPECPWRLDEPYWIRQLTGAEFVAVVREKRWQTIKEDEDSLYFADPTAECSPELRGFAALVESLLAEGCDVRVWCWESQ